MKFVATRFDGTVLVSLERALVEKSLAAAKQMGMDRAGMCLVGFGLDVR
jgi:hypothetical protein